MGKFTKDKKRGGSSSPYSRPTTSSTSGGPSKTSGKGLSGFKMNTNLGQHILKNPGIAEKIVEKANLKQGDVRDSILFHSTHPSTLSTIQSFG